MATFKAMVRTPRKDGFYQVYIRVVHNTKPGTRGSSASDFPAIAITISFLYWIDKCSRDNKKRHEEFQREHKAIVESIRRQRAMNDGAEVDDSPCRIVNDDYDPMEIGVRVASRPKPKKPKRAKPEWWRFITEVSIGSLLEKRRQKKAEAEACKNDPWSSR